MSGYAYVGLDETGEWWVLETEYDPGFVAAIKAEVHARDRRWEPSARWWFIRTSRMSQDEVVRFLARWYIVELDKDSRRPGPGAKKQQQRKAGAGTVESESVRILTRMLNEKNRRIQELERELAEQAAANPPD
jgi:hypothetical protein